MKNVNGKKFSIDQPCMKTKAFSSPCFDISDDVATLPGVASTCPIAGACLSSFTTATFD